MININEVFLTRMLQEIGYAFQHGVNIKTPATYSFPPKGIINNNANLPKSILDLYNQTSGVEIIWELQQTEENTKQFKEDTFLNEKYLNNNYTWGVVHEYLSGFINITKAENLFNPNFCRDQAFYHTLSNKEENQDDFFPFDICWSLTACLKREGDEIVDNIWLVHTDAAAIYNMEITIEEYLNLAYQAKGFHYWQLSYLFKEKTEYHELIKRFLPKILPHVTLDLKAFEIENV
ncbi:hypothetical protein KO494_12655 [Lacinutrix sp. C3R15]|uniref:hypothetical protein n=1 Tax=Flavobacteriaceae TaxID=49546 RepID=UPI001C091BFD|nr:MULTISPECIES: hypothetical protein [Flavobacteriaceae]MBU2940389.1 hypothetical protein [Lacinutrix sp. C3R15]MDO6623709.1 hypothetical protein [Oceanihabitans sp. 1_MG-2023]